MWERPQQNNVTKVAGGLWVNEYGQLVTETELPLGPVTFTKPVAYQEIEGKRVNVDVEYNIQKKAFGIMKDKKYSTKRLCL